ncbi:MAG: SIMPL domain-containing protein [Candidatus Moranbacteria bacterium]|jgi:uncharacterized protein YggE|nr:SIMPL domain-containing protein [Candidatus Moranbacteria bacterium]
MYEQSARMLKALSVVLIAVAAVMASYQYKISVSTTYPTRTFSVDGKGDIDAVPDLATFTATVMTDGGKNVTDVQSANTEKMNKVTAYLKDQGVDKKDLKTAQYDLSPRYSYGPCERGNCPAPVITGYILTQTVAVKVRNSDKLGDLLTGVVTNGANTVSEIRFVVDDDSSVKDAAREKAITEAKKKASAIAKATGFRLGKLVSLYENTNFGQFDGYGMGGGDAPSQSTKVSAVPPTVEPGTNKTQVQVTLTYEIVN